jgi:fibronectin-binding autotransporter adhesin
LNANASTSIPAVTVSGALNLNGTVNVTVTGSGLTGPNTYLLMSYGSKTGSGSFVAGSLPLVAGYVATLTNNTSAKQLQLVYVAAPQAVKWAVGNGNWDTATKNWQLLAGSVLTNYNEGSLAAFDDSASGSSPITVTLAANRSPGGITNNSSVINYILAGSASINGGTTIIKNGSSTLTIDDSGPNVLSAATINGGALQLGTNDANGDLGSAVVTNNGALIFDRTDNPTSANVISGSGSLVQNGSGILTVTTANTYSNLTVVNSGQLVLANGSAVQNSTVSNNVANGVGFSGITTATIGGLSGTGNITLTNAAGAAVTLVSGGNNQSTAYGGTFTGGGTLQQAGAGVLTLSGNSVLTTLQVINGGTVSIAGGTSTNANLQIVTANGGTLSLSGGNTTVTTDSRIGVANGVWNVSGSAILNLSKLVLGSASSANVNNVMTVSGNAVVNQNQTGSTGELWIGGNNAGSGSLVLKDFAVWTNSVGADVEVGRGINGGTGVFTITNNATFFFNNVINVAQNASGTGALGTVNLNGGTVCVTGFVNGSGNGGTINANGGTITALATSANFFSNFTGAGGTNSVNLQSGGLGFNLNGNTVTIGNSLSGAGGLSVMGGGTLTLSASNSYTGATYVGNSTLILPGSASIAAGAGLSLTNATLQFAVTGNSLTNFVTGTFSTPGLPSTINISSFAGSGTPPFPITIIKYTTGVGLVDGGNNLTNLTLASLASATPQGDLTGYLTNNAVKHSIDLVITGGTITPQFTFQPSPISRYAGYTAQFTALASGATGYQWQTNLVNIFDGGNLFGSATTTLTITNVSSANATSYDVVATNVAGSATSSSASLTIVTPDCTYEGAIVSNNPVAYYRFNETGDPINTPNLPAYDYAGGYDGVYGSTVLNVTYGINGPQPGTGFPGFDSGNGAAQFTPGSAYANTSLITVSNGLPVVTNALTLVGWVYPLGAETNFSGLIFSRGTNVLGLGYSSSTDGNGNYTLGYTWNNDANTYNWNSGLVPPQNQWSMVALVVTSTNATIYIGNTNGLVSSVHTYAHVAQSLNGIITIGDDRSSGSAGSRIFNGNMDEVSVFNQALTQGQILNVLGAAVGTTNFPPAIVSQPASQTAVVADNIQFTVGVAGTPTLSYQWQAGTNGVYVNLTDGGQFSGSQTSSLMINSLALTDPTNYVVIVTNNYGSVTSSLASLTILASRPVVTLLASDASGSSSFNTAGNWSDSNVPNSSSDYLNNTFTLRSPTSGNATFAGHSLVLSNSATLAFKTSGTLTIGTAPSTGLFLDNSDVGGWNGSSSTLAGYLTLDADGGTMDPQIFSIINLTTIIGGSGALTVASPSGQYGGTVVLLSSNSYSGGTLVSAIDKLQLSGSGTLGSVNGDLTMNVTQGLPGTGTLDLNGTSQSVGNLTGNTNALILDNAASTSSTLTIGNGNAMGGNFGGVIANGNGTVALAKVGTGTITLSGADTYTGNTLINGGTLALSGSATVGATAIKIASGATLDVSGLGSPLSLGSGQSLTGVGATGTVNGSLNLSTGSLVLNYFSGTPTLSVANGTLTMNNNTVTVTNLGSALSAGSYKIVSAGSGGSVAGSVSSSSVSVQGGGVAGGLQAGLSINGSELYLTVGSPSFSITNVWNGSSITLSWPGGGQLLQATNLLGPWTTNNSATSPFTVTPTAPQMFYRVQH